MDPQVHSHDCPQCSGTGWQTLEKDGVRLFFIEDFSPYSWALLPADASPQWPFREGHQAGQRVPASFRQPAEPRHGAEHLRSSPRQARSLLDIRAAFWYGAVGREADLRWLRRQDSSDVHSTCPELELAQFRAQVTAFAAAGAVSARSSPDRPAAAGWR